LSVYFSGTSQLYGQRPLSPSDHLELSVVIAGFVYCPDSVFSG
jgi:hypothetical protein